MKHERVRILLVEDNTADVYLFRKAFVRAGLDFELTVIEDGARALAFIRGEGECAGSPAPDIAVLDQIWKIIKTSGSWRTFPGERTEAPIGLALGTNYREFLQIVLAGDQPLTERAVDGIESVLQGKSDGSSIEYSCGPSESPRWFLMRVNALTPERTGVVISPDEMKRHLRTVLIAPMTTVGRTYPTRISLTFQGKHGQVALDQIRAVDRQRLVRRIGKASAATAHAVSAVLNEMFARAPLTGP